MNGAESIWDAVDAAILARDKGGFPGHDFVQLEQAT